MSQKEPTQPYVFQPSTRNKGITMSNPTVEKAARIASEQGRIHRVIGIQPKDSYGTVGLEQLGDGEGWEMFVSEGNCVFSILYLTTDDLKTLADFFGEMARASAKLDG